MAKIINAFPGYEHIYDTTTKKWKNMYRGVDLGFGGYVYAEPGIHRDVALLDVAGMHPASAINMRVFGDYTKNFEDMVDARTHIKHGELEEAGLMFGGRLASYLKDEKTAKDLSHALKITNNSVYGLTSAKFNNKFKDPRNTNNIVALRGALFMKTLQDEVQKRGFTVAHIKTDSIKIPGADQEIIDFCFELGEQYGYSFEHEATYDRMCLVNDAVYIALDSYTKEWTAVGAQFAVPYVFKTLFSKEPIEFKDLTISHQVTTAMYLDLNEKLPDVSDLEKELKTLQKAEVQDEERMDILKSEIEKGHDYHFVGRVGLFCPMEAGVGAGHLYRLSKDGTYHYVSGSKGYLWMEAEKVKSFGLEEAVDLGYFRKLVDDAVDSISQFGDADIFINEAIEK